MWRALLGAAVMLLSATSTTSFEDSFNSLPEMPSLDEMVSTLGDFKLETVADLDKYAEAIRSVARLQISKAFSAEARRYKREIDTRTANITGLDVVPFNLSSTGSDWFYGVTGFEVLITGDTIYLITAGPSGDEVSVRVVNPPTYRVDLLSRFTLNLTRFQEINVVSAVINDGLLWLGLGSTSGKLVSVVCVSLSTGMASHVQNLPTVGFLGDLHLFDVGDGVFMVVGIQYYNTPNDLSGESKIYELLETHFDELDRVNLHCDGVRSVTGFLDEGSYIIVIGMNNAKGSHIYQLDPLTRTVTLLQELGERNVLELVQYVDAHDLKHYIVVASDGGPTTIYWWDNFQLVKWQELQTSPLTPTASIGYITLSNLETVILIADQGIMKVFTDDLTGHYVLRFSLSTGCSSISDLRPVIIGDTYYFYYICVTSLNRLERRVLSFHEVDLVQTLDQSDNLLKCLSDLNVTLEVRKPSIDYLEDILSNDRLMTTDRDQVWSGPIVFSELTVSLSTHFTQILNIVNIDRPGTTNIQSLLELESQSDRLQNEIALLQQELGNIGGDQIITGPINANTLIIDNLEIDYLDITNLNGFKVNDIANTFLIDGLDQTLSGKWNIEYLAADRLITRAQSPHGRINGILTKDFMRLSIPDQIVTGNHNYSVVVVNGQICNILCDGLSVNINGIDTSTIVTVGSDVTFLDKKIFVNVKVNSELKVNLINGIDIAELASRVIYKDLTTLQTLDGQYRLDRVEVRGNIKTSSINGVDLRTLNENVVKKRGNYNIAGGLLYNSDLVISGSLITDTINNILWTDFVDLGSPDLITGMYHFTDATILGNLHSNDINGLDFSQDVVLTDKRQTINGRITFSQSVEVTGPNGVLMEEGGTVNGVDPSQLQIGQTTIDRIVITDEVSITNALEIIGNINVNSINGLILEGIENRYWSLTKDQVINVPVHLSNAVFNGPITAATLNGRELLDYLHNYGNEIITGSYTFRGPVVVQGELLMDPGRTVDGVDVSELKRNVVTLAGTQTITGHKTFTGKVTIIGDLELDGKLNGIDITKDLMRLDQSLPHTGRLTFTSKTVLTSLEIVNGDLSLLTLNGLDLATAAADLVLANEDAVISGGLQFSGKVQVNELYVGGDVDGVNLDELARRALLKNSDQPQVIDGRLLVDRDVEFLGDLTLDRVNGKIWSDHLGNVVPLDFNGFVSGRKIFTQPIDVNGNFNSASINGINVADLAERILSLSKVQTISGFYTFNQDLNANALFAPVIDGVDMQQILLTDVPGQVSGTVTFATDVSILNGLTSDRDILDGCNLRELGENPVLPVGGEVFFDGEVTVDKLTIKGSASSNGNIFAGGIDLLHFLNTLVLRSSDQIITAPMQFGNVTIDDLETNTINNIDIDELFRLSALMNEENVINCDIRFTNGLRVGSLLVLTSVSGRNGGSVSINGIDLLDIASRAVLSTGGTVYISGVKSFTNAFVVNNFVVAGSLGGVPVSSLVTLSSTNTLPPELQFTNVITVRRNLQVNGLVDGVDLEEFLENRINLNSTNTMFTSCTFENLIIEGDLEIGRINDVDLSDLVIRSASSQTITSRKILSGGLHVNGNAIVNTINGMNIADLIRTLVRKDVDTQLNYAVTFRSVVTSNVDIFVHGTVNGFDLSELNANQLSDLLVNQYLRIDQIRDKFGSIIEMNYRSAKEMYASLSYLESLKYPRDTNVTGTLWIGEIQEDGPGYFLKINTCPRDDGLPCGCDAECHYYRITDNARVEPYAELNYKVNILTHPLSPNVHVAIYSSCFNGVPGSQVRVYSKGRPPLIQRLNLGLISDIGMFVVNQINYIVTVSQLVDVTDSRETTSINVLTPSIGLNEISVIWTKTSTKSAVSLDLQLIGNDWYMLVTNSYDNKNVVDPYSTWSELYVWNVLQQAFVLVGEYVADHATAGDFFYIEQPVKEYFFCITQQKSADFKIYEDNLKYTANVLIYRFNKHVGEFEFFQTLDVKGVVDETSLRVDNDYYLLLVSQKLDKLYVFKYYHSEGFFEEISYRVESPRSVKVLEIGTEQYVFVSSPEGLKRYLVKTKGVDPDKLLQIF